MKAKYLDKLISGQWSGTLNLTEPQAGSVLAAVRGLAAEHELERGSEPQP
jgi:alkylation response protein AidB-like acyl-CoA dehydrogenase